MAPLSHANPDTTGALSLLLPTISSLQIQSLPAPSFLNRDRGHQYNELAGPIDFCHPAHTATTPNT